MIWRRTIKPAAVPPQKPLTDPAEERLFAEADALCRDARLRDVVWRHLRYRRSDSEVRGLSTLVHRNDQMLRHSLRHFNDINYAISQYFGVALQQHASLQQLLRLVFDERHGEVSILDFACGFGRSLRLLPQSSTRSRIWASDIQREAVDFVVEAFGVNGIYSTYEPHEFRPGRTFDCIWVASLFSHLPAPLFRKWLEHLMRLLAPRGVLCFSVHDERLAPADVANQEPGISFASTSEIEELDSSAYGTTFVSEAFVRDAVRAAAGGSVHAVHRLPRALANHQDLYVASTDGALDADRFRAFRRGPWGWADQCRVTERERLVVSGWAASLDDGMVDEVLVAIDGHVHRCPSSVVRADVRAMIGDERLRSAGWELVCPLENPNAFLEVSARSKGGEEAALLYAGPLGRLKRAGSEATD